MPDTAQRFFCNACWKLTGAMWMAKPFNMMLRT